MRGDKYFKPKCIIINYEKKHRKFHTNQTIAKYRSNRIELDNFVVLKSKMKIEGGRFLHLIKMYNLMKIEKLIKTVKF